MASEPLPATELLRGYIEPQAVDLRPDHDGQIRLSMAISAKRQADAAERIAQQLENWTWQGTLATTPFGGGN